MIALTVAEIADLTGGRIVGVDPATLVTAPAAVDSRIVEPGALFVAVDGEHVDGHDFAARAVEAGASVALVSRAVPAPSIEVADPVEALGQVAAEVVRRLTDCVVVGITGSQGKTSTKDLLAQILGTQGPTIAPHGNFNNEIGVPLTLTRATDDTRFVVVEMGARHVGDVRSLCAIARPSVGAVLNVGVAHLGEFGSREGIARAKGEMVEDLPEDGTAVLNADDPLVARMASRTTARIETFGESADASLRISDLVVDDTGEPRFTLVRGPERVEVTLPMLGRHQAHNAAAAAAVAVSVGVPLSQVGAALGAVRALSSWRMERHERSDGVLVINDSYNANPDSMRAALDTLAVLGAAGRRTVAVLGEMLELGADAEAEHHAIGAYAAGLAIDRLIVVGSGADPIGLGYGDARRVPDAAAASTALEDELLTGDVVLVKASRASGLERVAADLLHPDRHTALSPTEGEPPIAEGGTPQP